MRKLLCLLWILSPAIFVMSCDTEEGNTHDIIVSWNIGGLNICQTFLPQDVYTTSQLDIDTVEITIFDDKDYKNAVQDATVVPCDSGEYRFTRLRSDTYYIEVIGYAEYEDERLAFFKGREKAILRGETLELDVSLSQGDGSLEVEWMFDTGRICGVEKAGEIAFVAVQITSSNQDIERIVPCGDAVVLFEDLPPNKQYDITAVALDKDESAMYDVTYHENPIVVLPGKQHYVELMF